MSNTITHRPALGQVAAIGSLYDATTDKFLSRSIFNKNLPLDAVVQNSNPKTDVHVNYVDTFKSRFDEIGLSPDLSASVLAGLVPLRGSALFLDEHRDSNLILQAAIRHKIITTQEKLNFMSNELKTCVATPNISTREATHVVTEIEWGAQSIISIRHRAPVNVDTTQVERQFRASVDHFERALNGAGSQYNGHVDSDLPLAITIYGDVLAETGLQMADSQNASEFLGLVPQNLKHQNHGKGTPLVYTLVPVGMLPMFLPITVEANSIATPPSPDCLQRFISLFDQIIAAQRKMNDYQSFVKRHELYIPADHVRMVSNIIESMRVARANIKSLYAEILHDSRRGTTDPSKLWDLLKDPRLPEFSPQNISDITESQRQKVEFINAMVANGATYIGYNDIDTKVELSRTYNTNAYIFSFTTASMKDQRTWNGNQKLLLELLQDRRQNVFIAIVDEDARGKVLETSRIAHFREGKEVAGDMLEQRQFLAEKCFARYARGSLDTDNVQKPLKRRFVKMACPGRHCDHNQAPDWICSECHAPIEYGYSDSFIYCDCGRSLYSKYDFKCNSEQHGSEFEKYENGVLKALLGSLTATDNLNILILGETGVGKSTFINAFVNYLTFDTLEQAIKADGLNWVIPCSFSTQIMDRSNPDSKIQQIKVQVGSRKDENDGSTGESATQETTVYPVSIGTRTIRLIDTPGIGDTRGLEYDQKNMADILATLSSYDELHGILILLKSNNARLTTMFSFCVTELLTHLHRDSARNMVFGFTNTRISNYTPGDTFGSLESLLARHPDVGLSLSTHTAYCFDSESFRYLAAYKNGTQMDNEEDFRRSWVNSRNEAMRLLKHFQEQAPHQVQSTISLNSTRQLITQLTIPMVTISKNINTNIALAEDKVRELGDERLKGDELRGRLQTQRIQIHVTALNKPRTVCCDPSCTEVRSDGNQDDVLVTVYKQHCHAVCYLSGVQVDKMADPGLIDCAAFSGSSICQHCSHHWQQHMHIFYEQHEETGTVIDPTIEQRLRDHADDITLRQTGIAQTQKLVNEYKSEHEQVQNAAAQFGVFLERFSITPYNDATLDYLDFLIKEEKAKVNAGGSPKRLQALGRDRDRHVELVKVLTESMKHDPNCRLLDEQGVNDLVKQLYRLKHFGAELRKVKEGITAAHEATYRERPYRVKGSRGHSGAFQATKSGGGVPRTTSVVRKALPSMPLRPFASFQSHGSAVQRTNYQTAPNGSRFGGPSNEKARPSAVGSAKAAASSFMGRLLK